MFDFADLQIMYHMLTYGNIWSRKKRKPTSISKPAPDVKGKKRGEQKRKSTGGLASGNG